MLDFCSKGDIMRIWSNDFEEGAMIPSKFTCDDQDMNPHLAWDGVPEGTKSLALICDDPDAPVGTWVHWLVSDIQPNMNGIDQDSVPPGAVQVTNDFRKVEYGGPCPPSGVHRYFFKLYALKVDRLKAKDKKKFYKLVEKYKIAEAVLMGKYSRKR
jgi:Raf kinase inhibitor-like YbhB/YbcL family protein